MASASAASPAVPDLYWKFEINPAFSWFEDFAAHFHSPDLSFVPDYEDGRPTVYWLTSRHFTELTDPELVRDRAYALKAILDGALYLNTGETLEMGYRPFSLHQLWSHRHDGGVVRQHRSGLREVNLLADPYCTDWRGWIDKWESYSSPFHRFESAMLWMARYDIMTRGMLQFLGANGTTWITLYGLLDFMRSSPLSLDDVAKLAGST